MSYKWITGGYTEFNQFFTEFHLAKTQDRKTQLVVGLCPDCDKYHCAIFHRGRGMVIAGFTESLEDGKIFCETEHRKMMSIYN